MPGACAQRVGDKMKKILALALAAFLAGCGTMPYTPMQYPLRDGLIAAMPVNGPTTIVNAQPSTDPVIVYSYGGSRLSSNLNAITAVMVEQANQELNKAGTINPSGAPKTISLRVTSLLSTYGVFSWSSDIEFDVTLGDGQTFSMSVPHASGVLVQDLNGCIAEGVMKLLQDERVRAYLAS
jgi:hypothetical protein